MGNMLAALYYLWYFLKKSRRFSLAPKDALCGTHIAVRVCSAGFPTAIFSALMCVSTIVLNLILVAYGNAPVAALGLVKEPGRLSRAAHLAAGAGGGIGHHVTVAIRG